MKNEYIEKRNNPYWLPKWKNRLMKELIRDYEDLDGGSPIIEEVCVAITATLHEVKEMYAQKGKKIEPYTAFNDYVTFCFYCYNPKADAMPSEKTWRRYRNMVAWTLAKRLDYV